jgi:NAD(P)-dependent dehydrogenase (short-subunit alcohol dehydrogenase family)
MTQVLTTGATGKVGTAVARLLVARGTTVRALVRGPGHRARFTAPGEVEQVAADVPNLTVARPSWNSATSRSRSMTGRRGQSRGCGRPGGSTLAGDHTI